MEALSIGCDWATFMLFLHRLITNVTSSLPGNYPNAPTDSSCISSMQITAGVSCVSKPFALLMLKWGQLQHVLYFLHEHDCEQVLKIHP